MYYQKFGKPPKSLELELSKDHSLPEQERISLGPSQREKLEMELDKKIQAWDQNTAKLRKNLVRWNNLLEGIVPEVDFPFENSSNITLHYAAGLLRTFRASFNKVMYQDEEIFYPIIDPAANIGEDVKEALTEGFNYSFSRDSNGLEVLKQMTVPTVRDGLGIISGRWSLKRERVYDQRKYSKPSEFKKDYPDYKSAGVSQEEYKKFMGQFILQPDAVCVAQFSYDDVVQEGIRYEQTPFAEFVFYPTFLHEMSDLELYGSRYSISMQEFKSRVKRGWYYAGSMDRVESRKAKDNDPWSIAIAKIDGIKGGEKDKLEMADLVLKYDLDDDDIPEKYIITFALASKTILSMRPYDIRKNIDICVPLRIIRRDKRFAGVSLIGDTEDLLTAIDNLHRHRNNIRLLVASPIMIGNNDIKQQIDLGRSASVIRPGLTFWVDSADFGKDLRQIPLQNLDQPGNSMDEEQVLDRHLELAWGPTQGMSGAQTPMDPRAPATKTISLLKQANSRIDDYADELSSSFGSIAQLHAALIYQYYSSSTYQFVKNGKQVSFPLELLISDKIKWGVKRRSLNLTPEFAMNRLAALVGIYIQLLPLMRFGDAVAIEAWNRQVFNSGEPNAEKLLWDQNKAKQVMQQMQMMMKMQAENAINIKGRLKGAQSLEGELGKGIGKMMIDDLGKNGGQEQAMAGNILGMPQESMAGNVPGMPPTPNL